MLFFRKSGFKAGIGLLYRFISFISGIYIFKKYLLACPVIYNVMELQKQGISFFTFKNLCPVKSLPRKLKGLR